MRTKLIVGNWKMHGSCAFNQRLLQDVLLGLGSLGDAALAVCVPFPYLAQAQSVLAATPIFWGAQNVSEHALGAYTGEVSAAMLRDFGCRYVILGHSERRAYFGESDAQVAAKFLAAQAEGLRPIVCIGETLDQRDRGETLSVLNAQLDAVIERVGVSALSSAVLAYEPVWAIGTGRTATPEQAQEVHAVLRARIAEFDTAVAESVQILYGGSVKPQNAAALLAMPDIDGGLIGGASLLAEDFLAIARVAGIGLSEGRFF